MKMMAQCVEVSKSKARKALIWDNVSSFKPVPYLDKGWRAFKLPLKLEKKTSWNSILDTPIFSTSIIVLKTIYPQFGSVSAPSDMDRNGAATRAQATNSSCDQCECNKENQTSTKSSTVAPPALNTAAIIDQVQQSPPLSNSNEILCPIYVSESDLNQLMQNGHIFLNQGRLHYK